MDLSIRKRGGRGLLIGIAVVALTTVLGRGAVAGPQALPPLAIVLRQTSVSGLSSGAFMASQVYIAFSDIMVGAGIVAGGPYYCAGSYPDATYVLTATTTCMNPLTRATGPNTPYLLKKARALSAAGLIDPLSNLRDDHIYLFSGRADTVVTTAVVDTTERFFLGAGVASSHIRYDKGVDAGHAIITNDSGDTACALTEPPYINDCGFEQAQAILAQIYGHLVAPSRNPGGRIIEFSQKDFIDSAATSMSDSAFLYVPRACESGGCRLHVVLHGCKQGYKVLGDRYYAHTGYNEVADTNRIVVLYPQVQPSAIEPVNPEGCWDFWGYSSPGDPTPDFYTRRAPQLSAIRRMIARLADPVAK